jgi:GNAT superfamily N-acetyltransferase
MDCVLLFERPDAIVVVARWYYEEWGRDIPGNSAEKCAAWLTPLVNREHAPLHLAAVDGGPTVLGAAIIKLREMEIFPEREHWLGGVFVAPEFRAQGVAAALSARAIELAPSLGVEDLYLQTERLDGGLYARVGFEALERVKSEGHDVLVMRKDLRSRL